MKYSTIKLMIIISMVALFVVAVCFFSERMNRLPKKGAYADEMLFEGKKIISDYKIVGNDKDFVLLEGHKDINADEAEKNREWTAVDENGFVFYYDKTEEKGKVTIEFNKKNNAVYNSDCCLIVPGKYSERDVYKVEHVKCDAAKEIYFSDGIEMVVGMTCENAEAVFFSSSVKFEMVSEIKCPKVRKIYFSPDINSAFVPLIEQCVELKEIYLPDSMKYMRWEAFDNCTLLEKVKLPSNLEYIGSRSFENCINLKELDIPDTVVFIADNCFINCPELVLIVGKGSYAEEYAKRRNMSYKIR